MSEPGRWAKSSRTWRAGTTAVAAALIVCATIASVAAQETTVLSDFESADEIALWDAAAAGTAIVAEGVTSGDGALEITFDPGLRWRACSIQWRNMPVDWSGYDAFVVDVFNPSDQPMSAGVLVADTAWQEKGSTYWNRHNGSTVFAPGQGQWMIPIQGLYRGEAGSRNNDIKRNIDADQILRFDLSFGREGQSGRVIVDNIRLIKSARPAGVWAFDFGPPDQSVMPGWTAVSNETTYAVDTGYGWTPGAPWAGAARDSTFGPMLTRDFCEAGGFPFKVDLPPGDYTAAILYENSGYWGGEQSRHTFRRVLANGEMVHEGLRPDGPAHALWRFEDVEPIGVDLWDTYVAPELAGGAEFEFEAGPDGLVLNHESDHAWGCKVAGLVLARADDEAAGQWAREQLTAVAAEFRRTAVNVDPPAPEFAAPPAWADRPAVVWPVRIEDDVTPSAVPPDAFAAPDELTMGRTAVRGEYEAFCVAVRPLRDLGRCRVVLRSTRIAGLRAEAQVVRYNTSRSFNSIAYTVRPHTVRDVDEIDMPAGVTREFIVTVRIDEDAPPGTHTFGLLISDEAGEEVASVPLALTVNPVTLDRETDYLMGYFGLNPSSLLPPERQAAALEETLVLLREHGMNAVSGGPSWRLTGWQDGRPQIDFGRMDEFYALLKKHGFTGGLNGYGGGRFQGLHDGYVKGATGDKVEQESGLPYEEALMAAWGVVDEHARAAGWPLIYYAMCDETRVRDQCERELEFMKMMAKVSAAYPETVRTSGSYSVNYNARPTDLDDLNYWHQRFFEALDVSSLNNHDESVMAETDRLGKEMHIYNQGRSRYSFGLYQWSEYRKGVKARWQWHLNVLHGYQFFDLDGREPDTAMICYGRETIHPTIHFERCREGAEDFYLYNTLWRLVQQAPARGRKSAAAAAGKKLLEDVVGGMRLNQRGAPDGFDADVFKLKVIAAIEALQAG